MIDHPVNPPLSTGHQLQAAPATVMGSLQASPPRWDEVERPAVAADRNLLVRHVMPISQRRRR